MSNTRTGLRVAKGIQMFFSLVIALICITPFTTVRAASIHAKSCSYPDVASAVLAANRGDTVTVPSGKCNWGQTLTITKAITLQGSGSTSTKITSTFRENGKTTNDPFIIYSPGSADANILFRVTGFQFDSAAYSADGTRYTFSSPAIRISAPQSTYIIKKVRIDNNRFINTRRIGGYYQMVIMFLGYTHGLVDNNYFEGHSSDIVFYRGAAGAWNSPLYNGWDNGTEDNVFVEDNYFAMRSWGQVTVPSHAGSLVVRYNTFDYSNFSGWFYTSDSHGNQSGPSYAAFGLEYYGSKIIPRSGFSYTLSELRGGRHKVFYNGVISNTSGGLVLWETHGDCWTCSGDKSQCPSTKTACPAGTLYAGCSVCAIDGRTQAPEKTYIWNNKRGVTTPTTEIIYTTEVGNSDKSGTYPEASVTGARALRENTEFWVTNTACIGSSCKSGVGCGPTLPTTCTEGTGFWKTAQSCSTVPLTSIGPAPSEPISGKLYVCNKNNQWALHYTPYTYPHPLRSRDSDEGSDVISPPKGFKLVN